MGRDLHIDELSLDGLEVLRVSLDLSQAEVCRRVGIAVSTYQRWLKFLRGEPGGVCPQPRSLSALRQALQAEVKRRAYRPGRAKPMLSRRPRRPSTCNRVGP